MKATFWTVLGVLVVGMPGLRALSPCELGGDDDDIAVTLYRIGHYRQGASGPVPVAERHSFTGAVPSPFAVEVLQEGMTGFGFETTTFEGEVDLNWGGASFNEPSFGWRGKVFAFGTESELAAATPAGVARFRHIDPESPFAGSVPVSAWGLTTPRVTNFGELQAVDPSRPLTVRWDPVVQNSATDYVVLQVREGEGNAFSTIYSTTPCRLPFPIPGVAVMEGNAVTFTLPANLMTNRTSKYEVLLTVTRIQGTHRGNNGSAWSFTVLDEKRTVIPVDMGGGSGTGTGWVTAVPRLSRKPGGGFALSATPAQTGKLRLDTSVDLSRWEPWRTNDVIAGVAVEIPVPETGAAGFFRVGGN